MLRGLLMYSPGDRSPPLGQAQESHVEPPPPTPPPPPGQTHRILDWSPPSQGFIPQSLDCQRSPWKQGSLPAHNTPGGFLLPSPQDVAPLPP